MEEKQIFELHQILLKNVKKKYLIQILSSIKLFSFNLFFLHFCPYTKEINKKEHLLKLKMLRYLSFAVSFSLKLDYPFQDKLNMI